MARPADLTTSRNQWHGSQLQCAVPSEDRTYRTIEPLAHQVQQEEVLRRALEPKAGTAQNHPTPPEARRHPGRGPVDDLLQETESLTRHLRIAPAPVPEHLTFHGNPAFERLFSYTRARTNVRQGAC